MANRVVMKPQMKDSAFITDFVDERSILLMTHDTPSAHASASGTPLGAQLEHWLLSMPSASSPLVGRARRGTGHAQQPVGTLAVEHAQCLGERAPQAGTRHWACSTASVPTGLPAGYRKPKRVQMAYHVSSEGYSFRPQSL